MKLCECGHIDSDHRAGVAKCGGHGCECQTFVIHVENNNLDLRRIRIERLLLKPNAVSGMNHLVVMSLTYHYRSGVLDGVPIKVRRDGENYRIMDGRHRFVGSLLAGRPDVVAIVENKAIWEE